MNPYLLIGLLLALIAAGAGGVKVGMNLKQGQWDAAELTRAEKVIVRQEIVIKEVPKIVTKVVTREVEVEKEVERVVTVIQKDVPSDCVLPSGFGRVLVDAARAFDGEAAGGADEAGAAYGCAETLEAALRDLAAGRINSARLAGLQDYERTVNP